VHLSLGLIASLTKVLRVLGLWWVIKNTPLTKYNQVAAMRTKRIKNVKISLIYKTVPVFIKHCAHTL
jgi:hypothetical protein